MLFRVLQLGDLVVPGPFSQNDLLLPRQVSQFREFLLNADSVLQEGIKMKYKILLVFVLCAFVVAPVYAQFNPTITANGEIPFTVM